jgi:hypothetical protein
MMEQQLNGSYRAVFDGVASADECKKLADLGLVRSAEKRHGLPVARA